MTGHIESAPPQWFDHQSDLGFDGSQYTPMGYTVPMMQEQSAVDRAAPAAVLYRKHTDEHICPFGLKARALLRRNGYAVEDRLLEDQAAADAFMAEHDVETTPQIFIDGHRIGGYEALRRHLNPDAASDGSGLTYTPVIALFGLAALMTLAIVLNSDAQPLGRSVQQFVAISMCLLGLQKLRDLEAFSNQFLAYDLLAQRVVRYAYVYPFAETGAGLLMLAQLAPWLSAPVALFIGSIGAVSIIKAVYVDQRDLRCACVGGNSKVPLGAISLLENGIMIAVAGSMLVGLASRF